MITLNSINFTYESKAQAVNRVQALNNISCTFDAASFSVIVGASGCGKSTLLRLLAGLAKPTSGTLNIPANIETAFVFQDPTLLAWRTAYDNVALPLKIKGLDKATCDSRTQEALSLVGLDTRATAMPRELSGGMKMRVSLARALASHPQLLLMDEPFAALDERTRFRLEDDLLTLQQKIKCTIIFVTHSTAQAAYLGERVLVMGADEQGGSIKQTLTPPPHKPNWRHDPAFHTACTDISTALEKVEQH